MYKTFIILSGFIGCFLFLSCESDDKPLCGITNCNGHGECIRSTEDELFCQCDTEYDWDYSAKVPEYHCIYSGGGYNNIKPIIYLYPEEIVDVNVRFTNSSDIELEYVYPAYGDDGWSVTAYPDGTLWDEETQREYYSLYWEGITRDIGFDEGFVVEGKDIIPFLEEKLDLLGLNFKEANEFIIYWLPILEPNPYTLIHFATTSWVESIPITVTPEPDTQIRFNMLYKPIDSPMEITPQTLIKPSRTGFVLVEWGGRKIE
jgi:hypothetical protein